MSGQPVRDPEASARAGTHQSSRPRGGFAGAGWPSYRPRSAVVRRMPFLEQSSAIPLRRGMVRHLMFSAPVLLFTVAAALVGITILLLFQDSRRAEQSRGRALANLHRRMEKW